MARLSYQSLVFLLFLATLGNAHDHGSSDNHSMDGMDGMGTSSLATGQMLPYLHATPGDILWFQGWVPKNTGPMVGACIGLFLLAVFERWLAACRGVAERSWSRGANMVQAEKTASAMNHLPSTAPPTSRPDLKHTPSSSSPPMVTLKNSGASPSLRSPPFILSHDLSRGVMHAAQTALSFAMMLVVMTFQVGFILSFVVGLGVGETLFGRFANRAAHL